MKRLIEKFKVQNAWGKTAMIVALPFAAALWLVITPFVLIGIGLEIIFAK